MNTLPIGRLIRSIRNQFVVVLLILAIGCIIAVAVAATTRTKYTASTSVLMVVGSSSVGLQQLANGTSRPVLSTDLPSLATSPTILARLKRDTGENVSLETLKPRIRAHLGLDSTILDVEYTGRTAKDAIAGANFLGNEITRFYRDLATRRFDTLIVDLNAQLASRKEALSHLDAMIAEASEKYPYVDTGSTESVATQSVNARLITLRAEREETQELLASDQVTARASDELVRNAAPLAQRELLIGDPVYSRISDQFSKDTAEFKRISAFGSNRYPGLDELRHALLRESHQLETARGEALRIELAANPSYDAALAARIRNEGQVRADRARLVSQAAIAASLQAQLGKDGESVLVAGLRRERNGSEAAYDAIASRLAAAVADRSEAAATGSVVVLDPAQFASRSVISSGIVGGIATLFLSIWLACTVAVLIDRNRPIFDNITTIESVYGAPVIGSIV